MYICMVVYIHICTYVQYVCMYMFVCLCVNMFLLLMNYSLNSRLSNMHALIFLNSAKFPIPAGFHPVFLSVDP